MCKICQSCKLDLNLQKDVYCFKNSPNFTEIRHLMQAYLLLCQEKSYKYYGMHEISSIMNVFHWISRVTRTPNIVVQLHVKSEFIYSGHSKHIHTMDIYDKLYLMINFHLFQFLIFSYIQSFTQSFWLNLPYFTCNNDTGVQTLMEFCHLKIADNLWKYDICVCTE